MRLERAGLRSEGFSDNGGAQIPPWGFIPSWYDRASIGGTHPWGSSQSSWGTLSGWSPPSGGTLWGSSYPPSWGALSPGRASGELFLLSLVTWITLGGVGLLDSGEGAGDLRLSTNILFGEDCLPAARLLGLALGGDLLL